MMYGRGKSSPVIVAGKPANKAQPDSVTAAESVERRAGAKGNANQPARTGLSAGSRVVLALASIRQAAMLDCQYPRWEPYAGKLHVRVCAGGARQLASLPRLRRREFHNVPRRIRYKCFKYKDNSGKGRGGCTPACTPENRRGGTWEDVGGLKVGGPSR